MTGQLPPGCASKHSDVPPNCLELLRRMADTVSPGLARCGKKLLHGTTCPATKHEALVNVPEEPFVTTINIARRRTLRLEGILCLKVFYQQTGAFDASVPRARTSR